MFAVGYGDDVPTKIIVDNFGYVYVTGRSMSSANGFDYCTIKYNRFGVQQWLRRYDNLATHQNDIANSMGVHTDGSVYVTGSTQISGNNHDYCTIKYNSIGVLQWDKTYDRAGDHDNAVSLVLDNFGNCYVTGACKYGPYRGVTIRYNKTDGGQQWVQEFEGGAQNAGSRYITADASGNVIITGAQYSYSSNKIVVIKYNSFGTQEWRNEKVTGYYNSGMACVADNANNVIVTGTSLSDYFITIKYNSGGVLQWEKYYNGPGCCTDVPNAITVDRVNNIYVTGHSPGLGNDLDIATVKYNPAGVEKWVKRYDTTGTIHEGSNDIGVDNAGNVYVTGYRGSDMTTIRYSQKIPSVPVLSEPLNNAISQPINLNFKWRWSIEAVYYRLQIATDINFNNIVFNIQNITDTIKNVTGLNNNTNYWWRVNASNALGTSVYSAVWKFTTIISAPAAPVLVSPANGATLVATNPLLDWNTSATAESYRVQVSTDSGFTSTVYDSSNITITQFRIPNNGLNINTTYYWRVNATNVGGTGPYSTVFNFTTGATNISGNNEIPKEFRLYNSYPNPFNPSTKIKFDIPKSALVKIVIYNVLGKELKTLVNEKLDAGSYEVDWDATDYSSGVYFYKLITDEYVNVKKMLLVK